MRLGDWWGVLPNGVMSCYLNQLEIQLEKSRGIVDRVKQVEWRISWEEVDGMEIFTNEEEVELVVMWAGCGFD
jgi:hypothetical protein